MMNVSEFQREMELEKEPNLSPAMLEPLGPVRSRLGETKGPPIDAILDPEDKRNPIQDAYEQSGYGPPLDNSK